MTIQALKVHLRLLSIHGVMLRVVSLRPQTRARFSTNYYHETWHILAAPHDAPVLACLMWGLAFQRRAGTLVLIDGAHLVPTPFEADPPDPILLVPAGLTRVDVDQLRALKQRLRRDVGAPTTIRWHTFGMAAALASEPSGRRLWRHEGHGALLSRERMSRRAGFVCYTAPREVLCSQAIGIHRMRSVPDGYFPLAEKTATGAWHHDGEFQTIPDFSDDVAAAKVARRDLLGGDRPIGDDGERHAIWDEKLAAFERLRTARNRAARGRR